MKTVLVKLSPYDPVGAARVNLYITNRNDASATLPSGQANEYRPILTAGPTISRAVFNGDFSDIGDNSGSSLSVRLDEAALTAWLGYVWAGAPVEVRVGDLGDPYANFVLVQTIAATTLTRSTGVTCDVSLASGVNLDRQLLYLSFAGTDNGSGTDSGEGRAEVRGTLKPWLSGTGRYIDPVLIDAPRQIYCYHGYGNTIGATSCFEGGVTKGASAYTWASFAAMVGQTMTAGQWGCCPSLGMIRLGGQPSFPITVHASGDAPGGTLAITTGDVLKRILEGPGSIASPAINATNLSAINTSRPDGIDIYHTDQGTVRQVLTETMLAANGYWIEDAAGKLQLGIVPPGLATAPSSADKLLDLDGLQFPAVKQSGEDTASVPAYRVRVGGVASHFTHSPNDIPSSIVAAQSSADAAAYVYTPSSSPPVSPTPTVGDVWPDNSTGQIVSRRWTGSAWEAITEVGTAVSLLPLNLLAAAEIIGNSFKRTAAGTDYNYAVVSSAVFAGSAYVQQGAVASGFSMVSLDDDNSSTAQASMNWQLQVNSTGAWALYKAGASVASGAYGVVAVDTNIMLRYRGNKVEALIGNTIVTNQPENANLSFYAKWHAYQATIYRQIAAGFASLIVQTSATAAQSTLLNSGGTGLSDPQILNSAISINPNGTLSGAGGGSVSIGGLGYSGDLNATYNKVRGAWVTAFAYIVGDVVSSSGSSYSCILAHTSAAGNAPPNATYWQLFAQAGVIGTSPVVASISKENISLQAYANGTVISFAGAAGQWSVFQGTTDFTASATYAANATGCTGTVNASGAYSVTAMSAATATLSMTATYGGVVTTKVFSLTQDVFGYEIVGALPATNLFDGRVVFLTTDKKLYRYNITATAWQASVAAADITGQLADGQLAALAAAKITGQLTDAQLSAVAAAKVTGQLTDAQVAALAAAKITGQLTDTQLAAIAAAKITGQLADTQLAALAATKITGLLADTQIAALAASKITGQLVDTQIAALGAAKLTGLITTTQITDGSISTAKISAGAVTSALIAANTIVAGNIAAGTITTATIAAGAITTALIAANTILAGNIAAAQITSGLIAANTILAGNIAAGAITTATIAAGAVTTATIAAGAITTGTLAASAVTATELAAGAVTTAKITAGAVTATEVAAGAITTAKIVAGAVTSALIAANTIVAGNIAGGTITATELAAGSITTAKIVAGAITTATLAAGAVTANEIAAGAVTTAKLSANVITANEIAAGAVTAAKVSVTNLAALSATIGTLRTASTGARVEIADNLIQVFDASNVIRVKLGIF